MKKEKLTSDEHSLVYGDARQAYDLQFLGRLDIQTPTNPGGFKKLAERMEELFGLSEIKDKFLPLQFLRVCEAIGIAELQITPGGGVKMKPPEGCAPPS